jgi:DNA-binding winged helix-turn-helix (wHTH) protein/TolB-like protein
MSDKIRGVGTLSEHGSAESSQAPEAYRFAGFRLDVRGRRLSGPDGAPINLSSRAFDTLLTLIRHQGEPVAKDYLLKTVWPGVIVEENNLNQAICCLRRLLGDSKAEPHFIQTISGRGYCFIATAVAVCESSTKAAAAAPAPVTESRAPEVRDSARRPKRATSGFPPARPAYAGAALLLLASALGLAAMSFRDGAPHGARLSMSNGLSVVSRARPAQPDLIPDSVAVMPFTNLNAPSDDGLFAIALHDEIINHLARVKSLRVISRENVISLGERQSRFSDLQRLLRVESVITGTIMYVGDNARISLQMQDLATGVTLWTSNYVTGTSNLEDMIAVQGDIALNVSQALRAEINEQERHAIGTIPTESFAAYRYFLAAKNAYYFQDFEKTWNLTRLAIDLDPNYEDALSLFSYVNTVMMAVPVAGMSPSDHFLHAMESAERVIKLEPKGAQGFVLRASALANTGNWELVREEVAGLVDRGLPESELKFYALVLLCLGDFEGAIRIFEANLLTEPINLYSQGFLMTAYELAGLREQSRREYEFGEELNPVWWGDTVNLFLALGRHEPLTDLDDIHIPDELKDLLRHLEDRERVAASLEAYREQTPKMPAESVYYSAIAAYSGEHEQAVEFMREGLEDAWLGFHWLWLPVFDGTRKTRAFRDLLADSGIVDYWRQHGWPEVCRPTHGESFVCDWQAYPEPTRLTAR